MAGKKLNVKNLVLRHDTKANWDSKNPTLLKGELGIETDEGGKFKIGDGKTPWKTLPYVIGNSPNKSVSFTVSQWQAQPDGSYSLDLGNSIAVYSVYKKVGGVFEDALCKVSISTSTVTLNAVSAFDGYAIVGISSEVAVFEAERANADGNGNNIVATYATKNEVPTNTNELTNGAGFITATALTPYAKTQDLSNKADKSELAGKVNTSDVGNKNNGIVKFGADGAITFPNGIKFFVRE